MSSLTKPIKFRHLAEQLTSNEFNQFLSKFIEQFGKDIMLNSLFSHFTRINPSNNHVDHTIEIVSDIIRTRKDNARQLKTVHLNEFNANLIGKIGSFLNQIEYARFSICCRSILIGCNSPNTLQKIHLDLFHTPYANINLTLYPLVKYTELNPEMSDHVTFNYLSIANNLEHIRFNNLFSSTEVFSQFMNTFQFDKIKKFDFIIPEHEDISRSPSKLWEFFSKFKMIKRLELKENFDVTLTGNQSKNLFPHLKSIWSNGSMFSNAIINTYSNQLAALRFTDNLLFSFQGNAKFDKLTQLTVWKAGKNTIEHVLKSAKKLQKIRISIYLNGNDLIKMIQTLISSQQLLQYFEIHTWSSQQRFEHVFNGIEKGLFQMSKKQKRYLKIKIKIECKHEIILNDLMIYLSRIKNAFQLSNIMDFMLLCSLCGDKKPEKDAVNDMVQEYCDRESTAIMYSYYENNNSMIVLTNRNCKINGYTESWL